ncbi:MAG: WYL domain-containing protein, partial [Desulfobacterales bacterium]|nr:WYL domain-containing protein [Desulfobacterales bacterium]
GGNNKIENLTLLCEDCHSDQHGGRSFSGDFSNKESAFSKRLQNIKHAISDGLQIKFSYKKPTDSKYITRTVTPSEIVSVPHRQGGGSTLCVRGYCELRNEERTFALKRMKNLKVIDV